MREIVTLFLLISSSLRLSCGQDTSPMFQSSSQPADRVAAGDVTLQCSVTGSPHPTVQWFKDDSPLTLNPQRYSLAVSGDLTITALTSGDEGLYYCRATNPTGTIQSREARLQMAYMDPPASTAVQSVTYVEHEELVLDCDLPPSLPAPPLVAWDVTATRRVTTIASTGQLVISHVDEQMDLSYGCTVSNPSANVPPQQSSQYLLTRESTTSLFVAMRFVKTPPSQLSVFSGDSMTLECFTTGRPESSIQWKKDDLIQDQTSGRVSISMFGRILTVTSVTSEDAGQWVCEAIQRVPSGDITMPTSTTVTVTDIPVITSSFSATTANLTTPLALACTATGTPPLLWEWFKDGVAVTTTTGVSYNTEGAESVLAVSSVGAEDGGVYQCVVSSSHDPQRTDRANQLVTAVSVAPSFTEKPTTTVLIRGAMVTLPCVAVGYPPPEITWHRAPVAMPTDINVDNLERYSQAGSHGDGSLTISSTRVDDSSVIFCRASNVQLARNSETIQLIVIEPPLLESPIAPQLTPAEGSEVTVDCLIDMSTPGASQYSTVDYQWVRSSDGAIVANQSTLVIQDFMSHDNNVYYCEVIIGVSGAGGVLLTHQIGSVVITVGSPPTAPTAPLNVVASDVMATAFTAHWAPPTLTGGLSITNYTVEVQDTGRDGCSGSFQWEPLITGASPTATSVRVDGLHSAFSYRFRIFAFTFQFKSPASNIVTVTTLESAPLVPPILLEASGGDRSILVVWDMPQGCESHGGDLLSYRVDYRASSDDQWSSEDAVGGASHTLSNLLPSTEYMVRVAARTAEGIGPYSPAESASTLLAPPNGFMALAVNATTVRLVWEASPNSDVSYSLSYIRLDGQEEILNDNLRVNGYVVYNLMEGDYTFRITTMVGGATSSVGVARITLGGSSSTPFYLEPWFLAAVSGGGVAVIIVFLLIASALCYKFCKCARSNGKMYITSRRSGSSLSGGSSGFSEFQLHKHKSINKSITVHASPTPSRRTADYADMDSLRAMVPRNLAQSQDAIFSDNIHFTNGEVLNRPNHVSNGRSHMMNHHGHMNNGQSHMMQEHIHAEPPNFIESTNTMGQPSHMTSQNNHMISQPSHMISQPSHMTSEPGPMRRGPSLNGFIDDPNDAIHMYPPDEIDYPMSTMSDSVFSTQEQHVRHLSGGVSQQFVDTLSRVHTPPLPPPPPMMPEAYDDLSQETTSTWNPAENLNPRGHMTNNPVSRSNSTTSGRFSSACSTPQKVDLSRKRVGPLSPVHESFSTGHLQANSGHHSLMAHSLSAVNTRPAAVDLGTLTADEIQARQLPPIPPMSPDQALVEYSSIPPVQISRSTQLSRYPPPSHSPPAPADPLPPPPQFRHSPQRPPSPVYSAPEVKPKPTRVMRNDSDLNDRGRFEPIPMQPHPASLQQTGTLPLGQLLPENSGGSSIIPYSQDSWALDDLQRQFETDLQDLEALQDMFSDPPPAFDALQEQARVVATNDGHPVLPVKQRSMPAVAPKTKPMVPPKPKSSAALHARQNSVEDPDSLAINKQRPALANLKQIDPRKPRRLYGRVKGAVWQPKSANPVIESSSDESDTGSDFSLPDTVVGDTTSMKSTHV